MCRRLDGTLQMHCSMCGVEPSPDLPLGRSSPRKVLPDSQLPFRCRPKLPTRLYGGIRNASRRFQ
ncbi:hypothetical protein MAR_027130, partial [Mya arenaria]